MSVPWIGTTVFEDVNGKRLFTAEWMLPQALRPLEVTLTRGTFAAQRQEPDGSWVYRWVRPRHDQEPLEPYIENIQDVPPAEPPTVTIGTVRARLLQLISQGNKDKGVVHTKWLVPLADVLKQLDRS